MVLKEVGIGGVYDYRAEMPLPKKVERISGLGLGILGIGGIGKIKDHDIWTITGNAIPGLGEIASHLLEVEMLAKMPLQRLKRVWFVVNEQQLKHSRFLPDGAVGRK